MSTKKPPAVVRKEVVDTATWGALVVCALKASERLTIVDLEELPGESAADRSRRVRLLWVPRLLAVSVREQTEAQDPVYTADEWDTWLGTHRDELRPVVEKALDLNGWSRAFGGYADPAQAEDAAKNG